MSPKHLFEKVLKSLLSIESSVPKPPSPEPQPEHHHNGTVSRSFQRFSSIPVEDLRFGTEISDTVSDLLDLVETWDGTPVWSTFSLITVPTKDNATVDILAEVTATKEDHLHA